MKSNNSANAPTTKGIIAPSKENIKDLNESIVALILLGIKLWNNGKLTGAQKSSKANSIRCIAIKGIKEFNQIKGIVARTIEDNTINKKFFLPPVFL